MYYDAIMTGVVNFIVFLVVYGIRRLAHREELKAFLIHFNLRGLKLFVEGIFLGAVLMATYVLVVIGLKKGSFVVNPASVGTTWKLFLAQGLGFLGVSLFEEGLFRGYLLPKLLARFSKVVAVCGPALIFGALHLFSYSSTSSYEWLGIFNASLVGILLSLVVIQTKSLMWPLGYHLSWNLFQFMLLVPGEKSLLQLRVNATDLFTGSRLTPESGVIVTLVLTIMAIYIWARFRSSRTPIVESTTIAQE